MGLRINISFAARAAQRYLTQAVTETRDTLRQLSSGRRATRAADDPAALAVGTGLRATIRALGQGARNAADGLSLIQTADGYLHESGELLGRLRELALGHLNGILTRNDHQHIQSEYNAVMAEFNRTTAAAEFNGIRLLDGSAGLVPLQLGPGTFPHDRLEIDLSRALRMNHVNGAPGQAFSEWAVAAVAEIDRAQGEVLAMRAGLGAAQNRVEGALRHLQQSDENLNAAASRLLDVDVAGATARLAGQQIRQQTATVMLAQGNLGRFTALQLLQPPGRRHLPHYADSLL